MRDLSALLTDTGLLQFGNFDNGKPYRLSLDLLPSYPDVLNACIAAAAPLLGQVDHLLSTATAVPLGVGLSLHTGIPLVYSRGNGAAPVFDLAGAYDIGHPALLLANQPEAHLEQLISGARTVGLDIQSMLVIVDDGVWKSNEIPMTALLHLPTIVDRLTETQVLPAGQAHVVKTWLNRHPDSAGP